MKGIEWTPDDVKVRIENAARTLRNLNVAGLKPSGYRGLWPDVIYDENEAYGWEPADYRPDPPSPKDITQMDEALSWLRWLDKDHSTVLWMHADGAERADIQAKIGVTRTKLWGMWRNGLKAISDKLNGAKCRIIQNVSRKQPQMGFIKIKQRTVSSEQI
ncbi:MAG: helix-turn-helix domain-containing protein [Magnetococcales bacterium]|nr:helix-turn-helix domain-containing protein [Magnetococcales bacterium]